MKKTYKAEIDVERVSDVSYCGCDFCEHAKDEPDICKARGCIHAIGNLMDCFEPQIKTVAYCIEAVPKKIVFTCPYCKTEFRSTVGLIDAYELLDDHVIECSNCNSKVRLNKGLIVFKGEKDII